MSKSVIILLIILIISRVSRIGLSIKLSSKDGTISYYQDKIEKEKKITLGKNGYAIALLISIIIESLVIYVAISEIFSSIK